MEIDEEDYIHNPLPLTEIRSGRCVGNSSRIINTIVDLLYKGKRVYVIDHYLNGSHKKSNEQLLERLIKYFKFIDHFSNKLKVERVNGRIVVSLELKKKLNELKRG